MGFVVTLPAQFLTHTATVTPAVGDPFDLRCSVDRGEDFAVDPAGEDKVPAFTLLTNPGPDTLAVGAALTFDGRDAVVVKVIDQDGGITGFSHRELTVISIGDLAEARALQEAQMTAACMVRRNTGQTAYDPVTHQSQPVWDPVYTGKCRLQPAGGGSSSALVAALFGQQINSLNQVGALPVTATDVKPADVLEVTASEDLAQVDRKYTIQAVQTSSVAVARRFIAVENQG